MDVRLHFFIGVFGLLLLPFWGQGQCTDLFISEYAEGSSNNKYLEIYNPTGGGITLNGVDVYEVLIYANGNTSPTSTIALTGAIAAGGVYIIENSGAALGVTADLSTGSLSFNGNDAVALRKNGTNIDVMGTIGSGSTFAQNTTLRRNASVQSGTTTYNVSEWTTFGSNDVSGFGSHTMTPCSSCNLTASGITAPVCDDNGTPNIITDDVITFDLDPTGSNLGAGYNLSVSSGSISPTSATYGSATSFQLQAGSAGAGNVTVTVTDQASGSCTIIEVVNDPGICSACLQTVSSFAPTSGTEGTEVTITGTGFTIGTTVSFNGTAATVSFVSSTTIVATVPAGATTGTITVTESSCDVLASSFTVLGQTGSCGTTFGDLIISEVYDAGSGSLSYIEFFNGTGASINLADYRIDRFATLTGGSPSHSYNFPSLMIASGQVLFGRVSSDPNVVTPDFDFAGSPSGFNADDRLELVHIGSATIVDDWHDDAVTGSSGYSYLRNTTITGPNPTYDPLEWTGSGTESSADLGVYNYVPAGGTPTINTQPTDANDCNLSFTVAATPAAGTLTYQWYFNENDGVATGWTAVSSAAFPNNTVTGETAATLSITGDLGPLDGYQFYCAVIEDGSCQVPTEAVQFTISSDRFFRTAASGPWTNVGTWERASSAAGPWSPACVVPVYDNSDYIHILNTHTVDVDEDIIVDETVIEAGGTISINTNRELAVNNGTGVDLQVVGTLIDHGIGGPNGIDFSTNGGTWTLDANGTIIKTGSSSTAQYRNNYDGGIANIPATATWIYRYDGSSNVSIVTIGMFYPNLYFESTSGGHSFNNGSEIFSGSSNFATVKGSFYVGNTGTGTVDVFNTNTNATPMQIQGDFVLGGNGAGGVNKFENNDGTTSGTGVEVFGDIIINADGLLDWENNSSAFVGVVRLHGDWTDNANGNGFDENDSRVEFVGSGLQTVSKAQLGGEERFREVVINKASGNVQNTCSPMYIKTDVTFINGLILTSAVQPIFFDEDATATSASDASHVDGPVQKETVSSSVQTFTFPTGDNGRLGQIGIETRPSSLDDDVFTAEYFDAGAPNPSQIAAPLDHVSAIEYWTLDEGDGNNNSDCRVTLDWRAHSDVVDFNDVFVGHYRTATTQWECEGCGSGTTRTGNNTAGTVTSDWVTTFSPFTLADTLLNGGSLPLDLLSFDATKNGQTAILDWQVANEKAGDRYCLQRSVDAQNFETLVCFDATSDNATAAYNHIDETPLSGVNYYRIRHVDVDGIEDYSFIRAVEFETITDWGLYPNPANGQLVVEVPVSQQSNYKISVIDVLGRTLLQTSIAQGQSKHQLDVSKLAAGSYLIRLEDDNGTSVHTKKFVVKR